MSPLHYLTNHSDFGFIFAEIFVIEKRLPDLTSWGVDNSPTTDEGVFFQTFNSRVGDSPTQPVGESATPRLTQSENRRLPDSPSRGVVFRL
jgi:hypothetical protein